MEVKTIPKINFQELTILPTKEVVKTNSSAVSIIVQTPHKGEVVINYQEKDIPMFGADRVNDREGSNIIADLLRLQSEAEHYLLEKWVKSKTQ